MERGDLGPATYQSIRKVAAAVGVHVALTPRWRGVELAKLLDERHVAIVQQVVARLADLGWEVRPELTFAVGRETGSIDIFAWLPAYRAVLVIEVKSLVPDMQAMLSAIDRKRRLANTLARQLGWQPSLVGTVLVLPDEGQARNAVERYRAILDASFPARTVAVRRWLRQPDGDIRGIWFLANSTPGGTKRKMRTQIRVRARQRAQLGAVPRSAVTARDAEGPRDDGRSNPDRRTNHPG